MRTSLPRHLIIALERTDEPLRYGENPHQHAARYRRRGYDELVGRRCTSTAGSRCRTSTSTTPTPRGSSCHDLGDGPACAIIKHANPCGVAIAGSLADAYRGRSSATSVPRSAASSRCNRPIDDATVERMVAGPQADVVIAPGYADGAIEALRREAQEHARPRVPRRPDRSRSTSGRSRAASSCRSHTGSWPTRDDWQVVTKVAPTTEQWSDLELAWRICGHVKSNAIVLVKDGQAVGIGAGQQNRVESGEIAAKKAAGPRCGWRVRE